MSVTYPILEYNKLMVSGTWNWFESCSFSFITKNEYVLMKDIIWFVYQHSFYILIIQQNHAQIEKLHTKYLMCAIQVENLCYILNKILTLSRLKMSPLSNNLNRVKILKSSLLINEYL